MFPAGKIQYDQKCVHSKLLCLQQMIPFSFSYLLILDQLASEPRGKLTILRLERHSGGETHILAETWTE